MHPLKILGLVSIPAAASAALPIPLHRSAARNHTPAFDWWPNSGDEAQNSEASVETKREGQHISKSTFGPRSDSSETFKCSYNCSGYTGDTGARKRGDNSEDSTTWDD